MKKKIRFEGNLRKFGSENYNENYENYLIPAKYFHQCRQKTKVKILQYTTQNQRKSLCREFLIFPTLKFVTKVT
jgi:hypothetical protein